MAKQKSKSAAGRRIGPEAVTEKETGLNWGDSRQNHEILPLPAGHLDWQTRATFLAGPPG